MNFNILNPLISIIILNWNGKNDTLECLASVNQLDYPKFEIIVVDNGSSDGSEASILGHYPNITFLQTGENLGYAGGNNVGIQWALEHSADYVMLLNNDTTVASDLLTAFIRASDTLPAESVLGAKIYYFDDPSLIWYAGGRWRGYAEGFEHIGMGQEDSEQFNQRIKTDYITGCALFAKADTFKNVGLLSEDFFLIYEETDWCYRARALGSECFVIPDAHVWHKVSVSFGGKYSPVRAYFMARNKCLWAQRNLSDLNFLSLHVNILFDFLRVIFPRFYLSLDSNNSLFKEVYWAVLTWAKQFKQNLFSPLKKAKFMGYFDFYRGQFGNITDSVNSFIKIRK